MALLELSTTPTSLNLNFPSAGACEEQPVNEMVLFEACRLIAERAKMQALTYLYKDEREPARQVLQEAIATSQKLLPAELIAPLVRELEQLVARTEEQPLSAAEAKTVHYASYLWIADSLSYLVLLASGYFLPLLVGRRQAFRTS